MSEGPNQVLQHFHTFFKKSDRICARTAVATLQYRWEWTHQPYHAIVTDMEEIY